LLLPIGAKLFEVGPKVAEFLLTASNIIVPGTLPAGLLTNSLKVASFQVMPESFIPLLYIAFSTVPALRPSRPLRMGPILFFASSPTVWHGWHFVNAVSPAAAS
jgi:hypothetical protein